MILDLIIIFEKGSDFSYVSSENLQSFPDHRLACLFKIRDFRAFKIVNFNSLIHIVYV
jgi:hypothetical protein